MPSATAHLMQCMEVFGGNEAIDTSVSMAGLDAWVFSSPHRGSAAGGDVHYLSSCATGRISRFLVADVSGHGQGAASIATSLRALMRRYVNTIDQTRLIESLNREFTRLHDDGTFASAVVGTYWAPTDYLVLSNAGHPRPLRRRPSTKRWEPVSAARSGSGPANIPLGVFEPARYDVIGLTLEPGERVLVYTDSLTEARDPDGRPLGEEGLIAMLDGLETSDAGTLVAEMRAELERSGRAAVAHDDLTVLLFQHTGMRPRRMTLRSWWNALREFSSLARRSWRSLPWPEWSLANLGGALVPRLSRRWREKTADRPR